MTAKAEKAALESSRQLLRTGVEYLAAVTRRVQGLRAIERAVSPGRRVDFNHGVTPLSEAERQRFIAMLAVDDLAGQERAAEAALEAAQAETERSGG